jgi:hypothetical protein
MYQSTFRKAKLIFYALLFGQLFFCAVVYYLLTTAPGREFGDAADLLPPLTPYLVIAACALLAHFLNRLRRNQGQGLTGSLGAKVLHYRTSVLLRSAVLEAGNILILTFMLLTFEQDYWLAFALGIGLFLLARPSREEFLSIYQLSGEEANMI